MRSGSHPPLSMTRRDPWAPLKQAARERTFENKDFLYLAGDRAGELYLLAKGRVRLFKHSSHGRNLTLSIVEPGDFFGVKALFPGGRHQNHAQALTKVRVHAIPRRHLAVILEKDPSLALLLLENLSQRVQSTERRLGDLAFKSVPQRLAALLLDLAAPNLHRSYGPTRLPHRYTHQQLAEMINTHRETVTKIFNRFRDDNLLQFDRRSIVLLDVNRLQEMALR
ncbi:MAG: Crp/Fnr family transcriptional regulator [Chloroflexia bacterium]|nr:Crp/Fnr family transcriptional regulator [Chloroflexia bacterium]